MATVNPLSMSDEDFLKVNDPSEVVEKEAQAGAGGATTTEGADAGASATAATTEPTAEEKAAAEAATAEAESAAATEAARVAEEAASADKTKEGTATGEGAPATTTGTGTQATGDNSSAGSGASGADAGTAATETEPPNYEALYKSIVAPLKANGKTINVQSADEAIQLMQMGANYTRKMQALAPQRKMLMMLENSGMLDESQLSFAIDLVKNKNPEAIKKLLKEAGIDPLGIDTTTDANYREGNHRVSDDEAGFVTALEDLRSTPEGAETIKIINSEWDQASKDALWKNPEVMEVINGQRASGVYARVADEVERQRALGTIPANVPFIHAYRQIGEQLGKAGQLDDLVKTQPKPQVKTPVATRVVAPKPAVVNGAKASAASATRTTPVTAAVKINPLAQSDADFMKQFDH